jgi:hypothetical protein
VTAVEERTTATGPTVASVARSARGPVLVAAAVLVVGVVVGLLSLRGQGGRLDPDSYSPAGSRALATLLEEGGVPVQRVDTVAGVRAADRTDTTLLVPFPEALADAELAQLADLAARVVLVAPGQRALDALDLPVEAGPPVGVELRQPACGLPAAERAGAVEIGGITYTAQSAPAVACYASGGRATLLHLPQRGATVLGDGSFLTNEELDEQGNAALALGLLGDTNRVVWLVPRPGRELPPGEQRPLSELLPAEVELGALWLLGVAGVLALWRARRLGPVVEEPLPVVVRAAEAVEGRGRLYRAAGARREAAEALRGASRERLLRRVALPPGAGRAEVVPVVARRAATDPGHVDALLYGGPPADDAALVRLAEDLRRLESSLRSEVAGS